MKKTTPSRKTGLPDGRFTPFKSATVDTLLLTALCLGMNLAFSPDDIGFMRPSPSPYLIVPLLVGCRHGYMPGIRAGVLASLIGLAGAWLDRITPQSEMIWSLAAPLVVGCLCGGAVSSYLRELANNRRELRKMRRGAGLMHAEIRMLRHDMDENIRMELIENTRRISLEDDLRALMRRPAGELTDAMMAILRNHAQVREAALYQVRPGDPQIVRVKLLGGGDNLPEQLDTREHPMLEQAILLRRINSLSITAPIAEIVGRPHLIAAPIPDDEETVRHLLVVSDIPLIAFSARTLRLVAIVCKCMEECFQANRAGEPVFRLVPGGLNRRIYAANEFRRFLETYRRLGRSGTTEWRLCVITAPHPGPDAQRRLEEAVMPVLGTEDLAHAPEGEGASLLVLLAWSNANEALRFERRLRSRLDKEIPDLGALVRVLLMPDRNEIDGLFPSPEAAS